MAYAICSSLNWPLFGIKIGDKKPFFFSNSCVKKVFSIALPIIHFLHIEGEGEDFLVQPDFHYHRVIRYTIKSAFNKIFQLACISLHLLLITDLALGSLLNLVCLIDQIKGSRLDDKFKKFVEDEIKVSTQLLSDELCHILLLINHEAKINKEAKMQAESEDKYEGILTARVTKFFHEKMIQRETFCFYRKNPLKLMILQRLDILKICGCYALVLPGDLFIGSVMAIFAMISRGKIWWVNDLAFRAMRGPESTLSLIVLNGPRIIMNEEDRERVGNLKRMFKGANLIKVLIQVILL